LQSFSGGNPKPGLIRSVATSNGWLGRPKHRLFSFITGKL
jgi:hypothetical protein